MSMILVSPYLISSYSPHRALGDVGIVLINVDLLERCHAQVRSIEQRLGELKTVI